MLLLQHILTHVFLKYCVMICMVYSQRWQIVTYAGNLLMLIRHTEMIVSILD